MGCQLHGAINAFRLATVLCLLMAWRCSPNVLHVSVTQQHVSAAGSQGCCVLQAFGPIVSCRILTDPKTGISRCAGLLRFQTPEKAMCAIRDMHGRQVSLLKSLLGHLTLLERLVKWLVHLFSMNRQQWRPRRGVFLTSMQKSACESQCRPNRMQLGAL